MPTRRRWALPLLVCLLTFLVAGVVLARPQGAGAASQNMQLQADNNSAGAVASPSSCVEQSRARRSQATGLDFTHYPDFDPVSGHIPKSIWGDGQTLWIGEWSDKHFYAYNLKDDPTTTDTVETYGSRSTSKEFDGENSDSQFITGNGTYLWIAEKSLIGPTRDVHGYNYSDRSRAPAQDFEYNNAAGDLANHPTLISGIATDGRHIWLADTTPMVKAFRVSTGIGVYGSRDTTRDISFTFAPFGLYTDGETIWGVGQGAADAEARRLSDGARVSARDFKLDDANQTPAGVWSNGVTMFVVDATDPEYKIFTYRQLDNASGLAVSGTPLAAERLTADLSALTDPNGIPDSATYSYQWLRDCEAIPGATSASYVMTEADMAGAFTLRVSFTDDAGNQEEVYAEPTTEADRVIEVPWDWDLVPEDLRQEGDRFRVIFLTDTGLAPESTDIEDYNRYVQEQARAPDTPEALRTYHRWFRVLGSTAEVDARDNTAATGTGGPVYWLKGDRVANTPAGLYGQNWNAEPAPRNRRGKLVSLTNSSLDVITGSTIDGLEKVGHALGDDMVWLGRLDGVNNNFTPMGAHGNNTLTVANTSTNGNYYALSPVFRVSEGRPQPEADPEAPVGPNAATLVREDWSLLPAGLAIGDRFRLLFVTSTMRDARGSDIGSYNTFVRDRAASGHAGIKAHEDHFWAVASAGPNTGSIVHAVDNTGTNFSDSDKGIPIYWLNGNQVADDYADFYDGDWDEEAEGRNESGAVRNFSGTDRVWTGSDHNGDVYTFEDDGLRYGHLSGSVPHYGRPNSSTAGEGPLSAGEASGAQTYPLYGLSGVFEVLDPTPVYPLVAYDSVLNSGGLEPGSLFRVMFAGAYVGHDATYLASDGRERKICDTDPDQPECAIDEENPNIHDYNHLVQQMARWGGATTGIPISGDRRAPLFRALISTAGTDARDNTATTYTYSDDDDDTNDDLGVPIYWLGGAKMADDYRDLYDGTWDNWAGARNPRGEPVNLDTWPVATGSRSDGTVDPTGFLGHPSGQVRTGSAADPFDGGGLTGVDSSFHIYGISPIFEVRPPRPDVEFFTAGVEVSSNTVTLALDAYEHEDSPLTHLDLYFHRLPQQGRDPTTRTIESTIAGDSSLNGSNECSGSTLNRSGYTSEYGCTLTYRPDQSRKWYLAQLEGVWENGRTQTRRIYFNSGLKGTYEPALAHAELPETAPGMVAGLTHEVDATGITLSWQRPGEDGGGDPVFYRVERSTDGSDWEELETGTLETSWRDAAPPAEGGVLYRVTAYNAVGEGPWSGVALILVDEPSDEAGPPDPGPLAGFSLAADGTGVELLALAEGVQVVTGDYSATLFAIRANLAAGETVGSVRFELHRDGENVITGGGKTESYAPYSLYGDGGDNSLTGAALPEGSYRLTAAAHSERGAGGETLGRLEVSFTVVETAPAPADTPAQERPPNTRATGRPTVGGFARVGETLTADVSGIGDDDGLTNVAFSYQWLRGDAGIAAATGPTYTLVAADQGKTIKVTVSFTDAEGNAETLTSDPTGAVSPDPGPLTTFTVVDTSSDPDTPLGTPVDGGTLTLAGPSSDSYGIRVNTDSNHDGHDDIRKVELALSGAKTESKTEWEAPYSLYGDDGEDNLKGEDLPAGSYDLTATAYKNNGDVLGTLQVSFEVGYSAPAQQQTEPPPAQNTLATGAPTITGNARVGETLTANTSGIHDDDGLDNATFSYQWTRSDAEITGATGSSYTLVEADEGKIIKVTVTFTDAQGNSETLTSDPTGEVEARPNTLATGAPTIDGIARVGETLTADTSGIADDDGLTNAAFAYQWLRGDAEIAGAAGETYTLVEADVGRTVKVTVSFTDEAGHAESLTSDATGEVEAKPNTKATGAPTIDGNARVGETLTADTSGIYDDDGLDNATFSYQWLRSDGGLDTNITGATGSSYTLIEADEGKTVKATVSFTDAQGNPESLTSDPTGEVEAKLNTRATGAPAIDGIARVGETLTADSSGIDDDDGLDSAAFSYQWLRGNAEIAGATGETYTLVKADEGKTIEVTVSFTDAEGNPETLTSDPTGEVEAKPNTEATGAPAIDGIARVGETLTADTSGIIDDDGLGNAVFTYQWVRNDGSGDSNIQDATGSTYTLVSDDEGKTVKVTVSFTDAVGNPETLTSDATGVVAATETVPGRPQDLDGKASAQGIALTWTAPDGAAATEYVVYRGKLENGSMNGKPMTKHATISATASDMAYTDAGVEEGQEYRYRVAAVNSAGEGRKSAWINIFAGSPQS